MPGQLSALLNDFQALHRNLGEVIALHGSDPDSIANIDGLLAAQDKVASALQLLRDYGETPGAAA